MKRIAKFFTVAVVLVALLGSAISVMAAPAERGGPGGRDGNGGGGEVIAINGDTITVENPRGQLEIITSADTTFTVNGEAGSLADIQVGMFAGAHGERSEDGTSITATDVRASDERPERGDKGQRGIGGEVTAIDGDTITVENPRGTMTIVTTAETTFMVNGEEGSLADIQVGMFAGAHGERSEDGTSITATDVRASDERPERGDKGQRGVGGEVTAIDGDTITVENPRGTMTIVTTAETTFMVNGEEGSLADIQVGMFAGGRGELNEDGTSVTATNVRASDEAPERGNRGGRRGQ